MKIHAAEKEQVAGLLIYPELKDQGFLKPEFPYGPHLNLWVAQRGTLLKYFLYPGDPSDSAAQQASTLPKIPAMPISQKTASVLLSHIRGEQAPEDWIGWLPEGYRLGPGPASVRLVYKGKSERRTIRNIFASIPGSGGPFVVAGNHYDAWVYGASDPSSGTSVLLDAAHALGELAKDGWKPEHKIVFAFWDGEEYGMFGSTKWVQNNLAALKQAIAYINIDSAFRARDFAAYVSPGLYSSFDQALEGLSDPDSGRLFSEIRPEFQNPGFSGDGVAFVRFAGLPVVDAGFGRTYSVYHSVYDNELWMEKFGDPKAAYRATLARILGRYLMSLTSEPVIPYDFTEFQPYTFKAINELKISKNGEWDSLKLEIDRFDSVAKKLHSQMQDHALSKDQHAEINQLLLNTMQAFYDQNEGRNVLMEASKKLGCAGEPLPNVTEAVRAGDPDKIKEALSLLSLKFAEARKYLEMASALSKE
jgi:N-acetylated-alpha-linked acidic dipeptidase